MPRRGRSIPMPEAYRGREQAYIKHSLLEAYLEKLFLIVGISAKKLGIRELGYVDCFAGPWGDVSNSLDSTSIAISLRVLSRCRATLQSRGIDLRFRALYVEKEPDPFARLKRYLTDIKSGGIDAEALQGDFVDLIPAIQEWADRDSFVFFFVDPMQWLPVSVGVLKPLLQRPQSEFLINFMYDFANRAISMSDMRKQTTKLLGETADVGGLHGLERERALLAIYRRNLKAFVPKAAEWPPLSAYVRVLDPVKNRPKYHLVYLTTHPRGLVEFMEASEKLDLVQKRVRATTKQQQREERTGIQELFTDADSVIKDEGHVGSDQVEQYWIDHLEVDPRKIGYAQFSRMLEDTDWFPGDFQQALGRLIKKGRVRNLDAAGSRRSRFIHFDSGGERLQLVREGT